jgi:hypothetical protein
MHARVTTATEVGLPLFALSDKFDTDVGTGRAYTTAILINENMVEPTTMLLNVFAIPSD